MLTKRLRKGEHLTRCARGVEIYLSRPTKQLSISWWQGRNSYNFPPLFGQGFANSTL